MTTSINSEVISPVTPVRSEALNALLSALSRPECWSGAFREVAESACVNLYALDTASDETLFRLASAVENSLRLKG